VCKNLHLAGSSQIPEPTFIEGNWIELKHQKEDAAGYLSFLCCHPEEFSASDSRLDVSSPIRAFVWYFRYSSACKHLVWVHIYSLQLKPWHGSRVADSIDYGGGGACTPHFDKWLGTGAPGVENSKEETDQSVPIITKVLTKTTKCTFTAKILKGTTQNFFSGTSFRISVPLFFKFVPVSLRGSPSPFVILWSAAD